MPETAASPLSPSASLLANLRTERMRTLPFARMQPVHVDAFIAGARQAYFAPGEVVLDPARGVVTELYLVRRGGVQREADAGRDAARFEFAPGELFPIDAVLGGRAVTRRYIASDDCFCLLLPADDAQALAARSAPFADFLQHHMVQLLDESRPSKEVAASALPASLSSCRRCAGSVPDWWSLRAASRAARASLRRVRG